jgi:hypothetical protein
MIRLRSASAIVVLSLLTSAAIASAECAWVFWLEVSGPPTHESSSREGHVFGCGEKAIPNRGAV